MVDLGRHDRGIAGETVVEQKWRGYRGGLPGCEGAISRWQRPPTPNLGCGLCSVSEPWGARTGKKPHVQWSNDLPSIACNAQACIVYAPLRASKRVLGESLTSQEAAALVVAHLPDGCGPAFEGPWLPLGKPTD
ncbi:DUF6193 family natural product biosynthesis protein [Streptomyces sp. NBC_01013]|uniref:DUF6193 family natural product biosynthesis protein n=1 Tax=Streptomyces sp. NBC_01013 TaxID=2903718 RepID=UPI003869083B|nr:DUF6193 family natural product biosynthesis protein [Streptomyces sp. NBC_01013]